MVLRSWLRRGQGSQFLLIINRFTVGTVIGLIHYDKEPEDIYI